MAQLTVRWTHVALNDLDSAREYVEQTYPDKKPQTLARILEAIEKVRVFPNMGKKGSVRGTREFVFADLPFMLIYRPTKSAIEIIALLHTSRKWPPS
jgi:addiction module RelE/StbE family toxin